MRVASVSSTGRASSWSVLIVALKRTSPAFTAVTTTVQVALAFGANDLGSTMIEENVVAATGVSHSMLTRDMVRAIKDAGYFPVQRDTRYREVRRFE